MTALAVSLTVDELEALMERAVRKATERPLPQVESDWLTRDQAAKVLQVNPHQMPKLIKRGLPAHKLGTQWRFSRVELDAWLKNGGA